MNSKIFVLLCMLFSTMQAQPYEVKQITNFDFDSRNPNYFSYLTEGFSENSYPIVFEAHEENRINIVSLDYNKVENSFDNLQWVTEGTDSNRNPSCSFIRYGNFGGQVVWETKRNDNWDLAISEYSDSGWSLPRMLVETEKDEINASFATDSENRFSSNSIVYESGGSIYYLPNVDSSFSAELVFEKSDTSKYLSPAAFIYVDLYAFAVCKKSDTLYTLNYKKKNLTTDSWDEEIVLVESSFIQRPVITDYQYSFSTSVSFEMKIEDKSSVFVYSGLEDLILNTFYRLLYDNTIETSYFTSHSIYIITENEDIFVSESSNYKYTINDSAFVRIPINYWASYNDILMNFTQGKLILAPLGDMYYGLVFYSIWEDSSNGKFDLYGFRTLVSTDIKDIEAPLPNEFELFQNYPNPFNPTTKIQFTIPNVGNENVRSLLRIYDILGNEITTLVNEQKPPGTYEVEFNAESVSRRITSGIYFYKLSFGNFSVTKKMLLMK